MKKGTVYVVEVAEVTQMNREEEETVKKKKEDTDSDGTSICPWIQASRSSPAGERALSCQSS